MKRCLDLTISLILLLLLWPVMLLVALLIRCLMGDGSVLFRQQRPGLHGQIFEMVKFRTMANKYDSNGQLLPDDQRMTTLGKFLRKTSLDELPELINVIKGEMSLVGPRPLLVQYLERYTPEQARRHHVRPGITGWAQINGRNELPWDERFLYDIWYVDHHSLWLDFKIICLTVIKVLRSDGISQKGQATMTEFKGNCKDR